MKNTFLIIFILFSSCFLKAQDYHKIDSLKQLLSTLPPLDGTDADTTRIQLCLALGDLYKNFIPDSDIWWYSSIADTVFNAEKIKIYPKRAKTNATALRYLGSVSGNQGDYPKAIEYYEKSLKIKEEIGDKTNLASGYPTAAKVYIHLHKPGKAMPLFLKSQEITLYLFKDNFSILSEKEKELYLNETKSVFNDLHSFNIHYSEQYDSLPGICYNNELILKGLLLKSTRSMLDAVYKSSDPELKNTYFYLKQLRNQISELQGADIEDREQKIAELEKQANEQERNLVRLSSEFADIQKLFDYKWEDVQRALKPGDAAIEFVSFADELSVSNSDNEIASASPRNDEEKPPRTNSHALYQLIWQPLERALEGINTVYYAPVRVLNKISFFVLSNESGKFRTSDAVRSFAR